MSPSSSSSSSSSSKYQMPAADWKIVQALPGNNVCCDCGTADHPEWASVTFGILVCLSCSGPHRGLGTHLSVVRSVTMDSWTTSNQLMAMKMGGNDAFHDYYWKHQTSHNKNNKNNNNKKVSIRDKYDNDVARLYQLQLKARAEGLSVIPTELPPPVVRRNDNDDDASSKNKYQGFGSSPPAPPKRSKRQLISTTIKWVAPVVVVAGAWVLSKAS
mmetsp:Transcript_413/g.620  ORF Transcript_413/g.620 Transcript_413/m.620 type:complete len:215 (-) Transcript_413:181-825(-)|eukprot:CAMPEP_0119005024 /NCGR_PEP_ID=MMETSP1176-20130426/1485_1 /TAXON_ID=265551 /ORGANISM="Synedropsis recta cf, Strain CCMP1620" /LENGTH=214 /DNA_ID=CAMNT_0006956789 /DNA_START=81 /DNA_END=728 /DNA_ORIENTATION=+